MLNIFNSTTQDGSMKPLSKDDNEACNLRRVAFIKNHDIDPSDASLVRLEYIDDNYRRYLTLNDAQKGDGITRSSSIVADALVTTTSNHALFLPLADCVGAVIHDPIKNILMLSHLGRHNLEQFGGARSVEYLIKEHGVDPKALTVWLSPAAGPTNYPLFSFNNRGLQEVASEQLIAAGIRPDNITVSPIDVTKDKNFYSHSDYLKGRQETDGRFAVIAMMK